MLYGTRDRPFLEIWIEVVIEMDAVDVVAIDDIHDAVEHGAARLGNPGIDPRRFSVLTNPFRMGARHVSGDRAPKVVRRHGPEGIEPHMQLQSARMRLGDGERQRIIPRILA